MITNAIAKAQERREGYNFDIRKQLIRYDDVLNDQRQAYAEMRAELLDSEDLTEKLDDMREKASEDLVARFIPPGSYPAQWDIEGLERAVAAFVPGGLPIASGRQKTRGRRGSDRPHSGRIRPAHGR